MRAAHPFARICKRTGQTILHQAILDRNPFFVDQTLRMYSPRHIDSRKRASAILASIIHLITDHRELINQATASRNLFFPRADLCNVHQDINEMLIETGGMANLLNLKGETMLHLVARHGLADEARMLLEGHAAIADLVDLQEQTPLYYAARHRHAGCTRLLAAYTPRAERQRLAQLARRWRSHECARILDE